MSQISDVSWIFSFITIDSHFFLGRQLTFSSWTMWWGFTSRWEATESPTCWGSSFAGGESKPIILICSWKDKTIHFHSKLTWIWTQGVWKRLVYNGILWSSQEEWQLCFWEKESPTVRTRTTKTFLVVSIFSFSPQVWNMQPALSRCQPDAKSHWDSHPAHSHWWKEV